MRFVIIALLLLAGVHGCIVQQETRKLNRIYGESKALMIGDVGGALDRFAEASRITDLQTLGKASKRRKEFYFDLAESSERRVSKTSFSRGDGDNLLRALEAIRDTSDLTHSEAVRCQEGILEKAGQACGPLEAEGFLPDFEAYAKFLRDLQQQNPLDAELGGMVAPMIQAAQRVERYPLAHRTAVKTASDTIDNGLRQLGLSRLEGQRFAQSLLGPRSSVWPAEAAGQAEYRFRAAGESIDRFMNQWNPPAIPPDLQLLAAAAAHNELMMRVAYSVATLRRGQRWERYYLPDFRPKDGASELELRANWKVGVSQLASKAFAKVQALDAAEPGRPDLLRSVHYAHALALANIMGRPAEAQGALRSYRQLGGEAIGVPPAQAPAKFLFFY